MTTCLVLCAGDTAQAFGHEDDSTAVPMDAAFIATTRGPVLRDQRLDPQERIFGIVIGEEPRAYTLSELSAAEGPVHDRIGADRLDVVVDAGRVRVATSAVAVVESRTTSWAAWARAHPDTSLWRLPAVAEPDAVRATEEVRVLTFQGYRTSLSGGPVQAQPAMGAVQAPGLFVISGTIRNETADAVHHAVLRYELVSDKGRVVYREEGLNRSAEALAAPRLAHADDVVPIPPGATDSFRMIFLFDELPPFARTRVLVARVY